MRKVLIVGCGYLGRKIARRFAGARWQVTAWTSNAESAKREGCDSFRVSPVDIRDLDWIRRIGERDGPYDWVVDCVSSRGGGAEEYRQIYRDGAANLIRALVFERFLFTSSTSVYGQTDGSEVDENSPAEPATETGKILLETEEIVLTRGGIVTRLAGIYGAERNAMLRRFVEGKSTLDGDGSRWLNTIEAEDAVEAIFRLIQVNAKTDVYNVSDNGGVTQLAAFQFLAEKLDRSMPPSHPPDPDRKRGNTNKRVGNARLKELGWTPQMSTFIEGLRLQMIGE